MSAGAFNRRQVELAPKFTKRLSIIQSAPRQTIFRRRQSLEVITAFCASLTKATTQRFSPGSKSGLRMPRGLNHYLTAHSYESYCHQQTESNPCSSGHSSRIARTLIRYNLVIILWLMGHADPDKASSLSLG
jgi:hypothetical protein